MLNEKDNKKLRFLIQLLYIIALLGIVYFFMKFVFFWVLPFLIAFLICLLADPLIQFIHDKIRCNRSIISIVIITLFLTLIALITTILSATLFKEIKGIFGNLGNYIEQVSVFIQNLPTKYGHLFDGKLSSLLNEFVIFIKGYNYSELISGSFGSSMLKYAGSFVTSLPSALVFLIVTIVATYFTAISLPTIKAFILRQFNDKTKDLIITTKFHFFGTIKNYLRSYFVLMMITFAELSIAFLIFDIKPAVTLAFVISLVDILPILGVGTILIPWSIIELILGNPIKALIVICIYLVITIVRQILEPKVIGDHVGLLPIVTLFCIYVGLQLFGVLGMFLLPITLIIIKNLQESGHIKIWK